VAELNATEGSLLGFLLDGPKTGWDLLQVAAATLGRFWNVTSSHVYRELKVLEERGLIEAGEPGPRDRRPYAITAAGREAFTGWIQEEPGREQLRVPLLVTLWFGRHLDDATLARFLDTQRHDHAARLDTYRDIAAAMAGGDPHVAAVVDFGIHYEEAVLRWIDGLPFGKEPRTTAPARDHEPG
jgi:DNA-binding PadR family transcriptional regulator